MALTDDRLWIGHAFALVEYDNGDPAVPSFLYEYPVSYPSRRIITTGGTDVLTATGLAGLYRVSFD